MTLYLLKNVKLTPEYKDVFRTSSLIRDYISIDCEDNLIAKITGDWYWQLEGDFRMQLSDFKEYPNYAMIVDNDGTTKYYFISNFVIQNGIQTFHYSCDIWHTYAVYDGASLEYTDLAFSIQNGLRVLSNLRDAPIRTPITQPKYYNDAEITPFSMDGVSDHATHYAIIYNGYMFTGVTDMQGPSDARPFMGYVRSIGVPTSYSGYAYIRTDDMNSCLNSAYADALAEFTSYEQAAKYATLLFNAVSATNWTDNKKSAYAQISHCYIVPYSLVSQIETANYPNDNWLTCTDSDEYYAYATLYRATASGSYMRQYIAPFLNGMPKDATSSSAVELPSMLTQTLQGTHANSAGLTRGEPYAYRRVGYGTLQHLIDNPYAGIGDDNWYRMTSQVIFSTANIGILFSAYGEEADLSNDFEYDINYNPESALTAVQRENLVKSDTVGLVTSTIGGVVQSTLGILTGNVAGAVGGIASIGSSIANYAVAREREQSTVTSAPASNPALTQYYGLCYIEYEILNTEEFINDYERYGARVHVIEDDITLSNEVRDASTGAITEYPYKYTVVAYEDVNVTGSAPGNVLDRIRQILIDGTRIWNCTFKGLYDSTGTSPVYVELALPSYSRL